MLNTKKLLTKLLSRKLVVQRVQAATATNVPANGGTAWVQVPYPSTLKPICVCGYYLDGGSGCTVYNMSCTDTYASFALRNAQSTVNSVKVAVDVLTWGGVLHNLVYVNLRPLLRKAVVVC